MKFNQIIDVPKTLIFLSILSIAWLVVLFGFFDNPAELVSGNWQITPIAFIAATIANATAIGGGFLFVPLFIFVYGLDTLSALKLSLSTQAFGMTSGSLGWSRSFIITESLIIVAIFSGIGMYAGTFEFIVSGFFIKSIFGWVSILLFLIILLEIKFGESSHNTKIENDSVLKAGLFALVCFFGGLITAWAAIAIGEVVALYLLFAYRIRIESAIATGVAALAINSIYGFMFHIYLGGINWDYLLFTAPGVIMGGFFGARLGKMFEKYNHRISEEQHKPAHSPLKYILAVVILINGIIMLVYTHLK